MIELSEISSQYDSSEEEHVVSNVKNSSVLNKNSTLHKISSSSSSYPHVRTVATAASISRSCKNDTNAKALQLHIASRKES